MKKIELSIQMDCGVSSVEEMIYLFTKNFPKNRMFFVVRIPMFRTDLLLRLREHFNRASARILVVQDEKMNGEEWSCVAYDFDCNTPLAFIESDPS